ncbi:MAG: serine--tRNA ligase [Candidatus Lindowbacteria bacterium]|nr:serine--tRNA ligase [Candidatus Lindowbacteria bacterium]
MIDIRLLREDSEKIQAALSRRGGETTACTDLLQLDKARRKLIAQTEELKGKRNAASKEIGRLKKEGQDAESAMAETRTLGDEITKLDDELRDIDEKLRNKLLEIPNLPADDIPDTEEKVISTWGETVPHETNHWDIGTKLGIIDFERGVKVSGTRFYFLVGKGAELERALIAFMLDLQKKNGYTELIPPYVVSSESMYGTGQFPKFKEEAFICERDDMALIPTAEVPVTNYRRDEILDELPLKYVAHTPCFRREAGSYGKDTRGIIRVHQFNKIEVVHFVEPSKSFEVLEELTRHAESVLEALELPYRKILLPANDIGFSSAMTYDLEVWMPAQNKYVELSSCSNFTDYQARRMKIRYRPPSEGNKKSKPEFVHTLNGSAVAVGRAFAAILENYLQEDGSVSVPEKLRPFMGGCEVIR